MISGRIPLYLFGCFLRREAAYRVYDEFGRKNLVHPNEDGTFTVTIELPNDAWLYGFLLSFGTAVKVIEPQHVRDYLLSMADRIKNLFIKMT